MIRACMICDCNLNLGNSFSSKLGTFEGLEPRLKRAQADPSLSKKLCKLDWEMSFYHSWLRSVFFRLDHQTIVAQAAGLGLDNPTN